MQVRVVEVGWTKLAGSDEYSSGTGDPRALDIGAHVVTDHDEIDRRESQGPRRDPEELATRLAGHDRGGPGGVLDRGHERAHIETQGAATLQ